MMKNIEKWALKALSDSDFASDKETRISIFGYIIYFVEYQLLGEAKNEECCAVNNRSRIYGTIRSYEGIEVHGSTATDNEH